MAVVQSTAEPDQETVCIATKHEAIGAHSTVVLPDESQAREWLSDSIANDPVMGEYQWTEYKKTVAEPTEDSNATVYGTIETVPYESVIN